MKQTTQQRPLIGCTTYRKISQDTNVPLFGLMPSYVEAVRAAGGIPVLIPLGLAQEELNAILGRVDGILLPGGGDIDPAFYQGTPHFSLGGVDADRDRVEIFVAQQAVAQQKPLLAICRGHQILNVALGGTLWADVDTQMPGAIRHNFDNTYPRDYLPHSVSLKPGSQAATLLQRADTPVNSLHHQGIRDLADGLEATAVSADGLVEAAEIKDHPFGLAVQWHPENLITVDPAMLRLFEGLVAAANHAAP